MNILICAKVKSITELNSSFTFEPNQHGLYNISLLHRIFDEKKHKLDLADPESTVNRYPQHFSPDKPNAHEMASKMFLESFADGADFLMKDSNGDYWGNADTFAFLLKGASPLYADAVNNLESGNCDSYKDYAIEYSKKYAVYLPQADSIEGYRAYCIHQVSKLYRDLDFTYDFTVALLIHFDKLAEKSNGNYDDVTFVCWRIAFNAINALIGQLNQFDPELKDYEGFKIRYRSAMQLIKEETESKILPALPEINTDSKPETLGDKLGKAFKKLLG
jgi:hypothetical protein